MDTNKPHVRFYLTLVKICGVKAAIRLLEEFGGETVYFPMLSTIIRYQRDKTVVEDYNSGRKGVRELAKEYNISIIRIRQILKEQADA